MIAWLIISNHIPPAKANIDFSAFRAEINSLHNDSGSVGAKASDLIRINTARKATLEKDSVIAPFADVILDYRKRLGGFISKAQLMEVPGMDSSHYKAICNCVYIDTTKIHKISLNKVSLKRLEKHPYVSQVQAQRIVNYRKKSGGYQRVADLLNYKIINKITYYKIAPYLSTQ